MGTLLLIRHLADLMDNVRTEAELLDAIHNTSGIVESVDEQDRSLSERRHLRQSALDRALRDLRSDREEEFRSLRYLTLHPHVPLHQGNEALRD